VAVFQHGWLGGLFGVEPGPIEAWLPVMLFAIVFGLSMDYEVFLVSRIHEEWLGSGDASHAVFRAVATTGRVTTAAATIMICVFLAFTLSPELPIKMFGLSLASAVFLDAFVVRSLLLPAVLELMGRRTWGVPRAARPGAAAADNRTGAQRSPAVRANHGFGASARVEGEPADADADRARTPHASQLSAVKPSRRQRSTLRVRR
jgi:hypothetical protein